VPSPYSCASVHPALLPCACSCFPATTGGDVTSGLYVYRDGDCYGEVITVSDEDEKGYTQYKYESSDTTCSGKVNSVGHGNDVRTCSRFSSSSSAWKWISTANCTDKPWCCQQHSDDCTTCYAGSTCDGGCYWFPESATRCQHDHMGSNCPNCNSTKKLLK
jgi:hypothetical protein